MGVAPAPVVAQANTHTRTRPMQLQLWPQKPRARDGATQQVDIFSEIWLDSSCTTQVAAPATALPLQACSGNLLVASSGIAKSCPKDFDLDAFFDEHLSCNALAPAVSEQCSKTNVIESLIPCFPNAGTSTVIGALAAPAMDARSVNDITGSII